MGYVALPRADAEGSMKWFDVLLLFQPSPVDGLALLAQSRSIWSMALGDRQCMLLVEFSLVATNSVD